MFSKSSVTFISLLLAAFRQANAANTTVSSKFTKTVDADGLIARYIDMNSVGQTFIKSGESIFKPAKLRFDPKTMLIDLTDCTFCKLDISQSRQ